METNTKELIENFIARGGFEISEKFCYEDNDSMVDLWRIQSALKISLIEPNKNSIENLAFWSEYSQIDYPKSVWNFLSSIPADDKSGKSRKDQLINRWISDSNLPDFTDPQSTKQLDVITASIAHKRALTISSLTTRKVMLEQLSGEILKMKRMLLELSMVTSGEKAI